MTNSEQGREHSTMMSNTELVAAIREGEARNAADPHGMGESEREPVGRTAPASVTCNCGRRFEARTYPMAAASWRRHHTTETDRRELAAYAQARDAEATRIIEGRR